jgi:hypothetical protein
MPINLLPKADNIGRVKENIFTYIDSRVENKRIKNEKVKVERNRLKGINYGDGFKY